MESKPQTADAILAKASQSAGRLPKEKWRNLGAAERLYRNEPLILKYWIHSGLGRYGLAAYEEEVNPENENTFDATHRYFICNLETGSWTEYKSNTGIFQSLQCHYWLREDKLVVIDFSDTSRCLRQHILELNHITKEVNCNTTRSYRWNVDEIHINGGSDAYAVEYKGDAYIAVTGSSVDQLRCRLLPFNPLSLKPPLELVISTDAIRTTIANDVRFHQKLQPFCHGSRLVFRLSEVIDESDYPLHNEFFTIDLKKVQLDRDGVARIGMPEASLGLLKLPALNFYPEGNTISHYALSNAEYMIICYQWEDESSKDASNSEPKEWDVFMVNLRESSIVRMSIAMAWDDWLTIHPSGALLHWRQSAGLLQCLNRPRPMCRPPSLMNYCKQRLLLTDSHKPEDKFINGLLFG